MDQFGRRRQLACKLYWYPYTQYIGEDDKKIAKEEEAFIRPFRIHFFFLKKKSSHLETQKKRKNSLGRGERLEEKRKVLIYRPASSCAIHQAKLEDMPGER